MNLMTGNIRTIYFKYLLAAFGSAMITSIYSIVDMAMVGQYQGPDGTEALALVAPIWNIIYSLGLLMGIGGSILLVSKQEKAYFSSSLVGAFVLSLITWICLVFFEKDILIFFGANDTLLPLAHTYLQPIQYVIPFFLFNQMLAAFLRNDNNPSLATFSVLAGGLFNCVGDYLFVFTFDMGIYGAGLATAIGSCISFLCMLTHFFSTKCTLQLQRPTQLLCKLKEITVIGFSTFFIDAAMGILTVLFNRQIMQYYS